MDLDDNRFCPAMLKMAGELPEMSQAHYEKHLAIRHFRADQQRIEIEAECENYTSYIETTRWFSWIREEVHLQMGKWFEIVPSRDFGLLPSVGDLKVHLKNWEVFSENKRPHFDLDNEKVFELLQGAGLYDKKEQAIRELLQNAIDASLIRIWLEYNENYKQNIIPCIKETDAPRTPNVLEIFEKFSIQIKIEKHNDDEKFNYWHITICDKGTGISRKDLSYMATVGSSVKNNKRRQVIEGMPIWMKPSGIFSIGFQSIFLLTDEAVIKTRSIDTGETLEIKFTNPVSKEKGNIYFRKIESWNFDNYGTQLSFVYKSDKSTGTVSLNKGYSSDALKSYDELLNNNTDFNILNICEEIKSFFDYSFLNGTLELEKYSINETLKPKENYRSKNYYYSEENKLEIRNMGFSYGCNIHYYYRNQKIDKPLKLKLNFLVGIVNLLDERADEIITINRNKIKESSTQELFKRISCAVQDFFKSQSGKDHYQKKAVSDSEKAMISAEYELQHWEAPEYFNVTWKQAVFFPEFGKFGNTIESLENYDLIFLFSDFLLPFGGGLRNHDLESKIDEIFNRTTGKYKKPIKIRQKAINPIAPLIYNFLKLKGFYSKYCFHNDEGIEAVLLTRKKTEPISIDNISWYCNEISQEGSSLAFNKRDTIPCLIEYEILSLKTSSYVLQGSFTLDGISSRMLFPLAKINSKITVGNLDNLGHLSYL